MEIEYAEQYLNKLEMLPTKSLIKKIIKLKPLEKCDFYLTSEVVKNINEEKQFKIVHIYPNSVALENKKKKLIQSEDNKQNSARYLKKNIESIIKPKTKDENKILKEKIASIKKIIRVKVII